MISPPPVTSHHSTRRWPGQRCSLSPSYLSHLRPSGTTVSILAPTSATCYLSPTVWGGRLSKRFCSMFSWSSPCLLGQHGSCSTAQLPVDLSENMLQNLFPNLPPQTVQSWALQVPIGLPTMPVVAVSTSHPSILTATPRFRQISGNLTWIRTGNRIKAIYTVG